GTLVVASVLMGNLRLYASGREVALLENEFHFQDADDILTPHGSPLGRNFSTLRSRTSVGSLDKSMLQKRIDDQPTISREMVREAQDILHRHLKRVGLKQTAQRDTILRTFLETRDHLST